MPSITDTIFMNLLLTPLYVSILWINGICMIINIF